MMFSTVGMVGNEQVSHIAPLAQLSTEEAISSLSKWKGMEETAQLLESVQKKSGLTRFPVHVY